MQKYIDTITEYSKNTYRNMTRKAEGELKYPFLVPGSASYNDCLWDWDSWLSDIAIRQIMKDNCDDNSEILACEKGCILNFLDYADDEGRIPISVKTTGIPDMFKMENSNIHKPCFAQHIAFIIMQENGEADWIEAGWSKVERYTNYYFENFYHKETGLFFWKNDFAIGVDNDPCTFYRPENSSASIYLNCLMYKELEAMAYISRKLGKDDRFYDEKAEKLKSCINEHMWDEKCGLYFSVDLNLLPIDKTAELHSGMPRHWHCLIQRIDVWSCFMAMWAGIADEHQAKRMICENMMNADTFNAEYGIRTLSKLEKMYCIVKSGNPSCWLGPVWGISNYICFRALVKYSFEKEAKELAEKTITLFGEDLIKTGDLHEYYHPDSGMPIMNPGFQNWNLLAINMLTWLNGDSVVDEF